MKERFKILLAHDGSECANGMLADLQRAGLPRKAEAHVLSVYAEWLPAITSFGMVETRLNDVVSADERETLGIARRARAILLSIFPDWEVHAEAYAGSPARVILQRAEDLQPDLILVGSHGRSAWGRLFLGSVSQKVLHAARTTVRIARGREVEPGTPIRLLVGVDGSSDAQAAIKAIAQRPWPAGSEARIVHGLPTFPPVTDQITMTEYVEWMTTEKARIEEVIKAATDQLKGANLAVSVTMEELDARHLLVKEAETWGADCIFVGARGLGAVSRFLLGSVSTAVAARAHCSVEVVRELAAE